MKNKFVIATLLTTMTWGCLNLEGTTNSSPRLTEDFTLVTDQIKGMTNAEAVSLEDFLTKKGTDTVKRELRIDLTKPNPFPDSKTIKDIIYLVRSKLVDSAQFDTYTVAEVPRQNKDNIVLPAQKILKSFSFKAKNL